MWEYIFVWFKMVFFPCVFMNSLIFLCLRLLNLNYESSVLPHRPIIPIYKLKIYIDLQISNSESMEWMWHLHSMKNSVIILSVFSP